MIKIEQDRMTTVYNREKLHSLFGDDLSWILQLCEEHSITIHGLDNADGLSNENAVELFEMLLCHLTSGPLLLEL